MSVTIRSLPVMLTESELALRSDALARKVKERAAVVEERKAAMSDFKSQVEDIDVKIHDLSEVVATKHEMRPVECSLEEERGAATMKLVRLDTGEVVESRPMTEAERQVRLFGGPAGVAADAAVRAAVDKLVPEKGSGIDSVTISTPGHEPVTLHAREKRSKA